MIGDVQSGECGRGRRGIRRPTRPTHDRGLRLDGSPRAAGAPPAPAARRAGVRPLLPWPAPRLIRASGDASYRPSAYWLLDETGDDPELRELAFATARRCLDVFEGIEPLEPRRQALIALHELRPADPALAKIDVIAPLSELPRPWDERADEVRRCTWKPAVIFGIAAVTAGSELGDSQHRNYLMNNWPRGRP